MKKLSNLEFSKMSLDELKQVGTVLDAEDQRKYIGGTSISEAYAMMNAGTWTGGYVDGMGYVSLHLEEDMTAVIILQHLLHIQETKNLVHGTNLWKNLCQVALAW